jgi:hypothetical protein
MNSEKVKKELLAHGFINYEDGDWFCGEVSVMRTEPKIWSYQGDG